MMKKLTAMLLTMAIIVTTCLITAFAAGGTQDGIEMELTTDQTTYTAEENITAALTVTNTNDFSVRNVVLESLIPESYQLASDSEAVRQIEILDAEESATLNVTYTRNRTENNENTSSDPGSSNSPESSIPPQTGSENVSAAPSGNGSQNSSDSQNGANGGGTIQNSESSVQNPTGNVHNPAGNIQDPTDNVQNPEEAAQNSQGNAGKNHDVAASPKTGDNGNMILYIALASLAGAGIITVLLGGKKKRKTVLSILLCIGMFVSFTVSLSPAYAAGTEALSRTAEVSTVVRVADQEVTLEAKVSYTLPESSAPGNDDHTEERRNVLVAYFSATNTTERLSEYLADGIGADLYEIVPEIPYTSADLNYGDSSSRTSMEMNDPNARPAIAGSVEHMGQYDIVFIGYPIWWGQAPRIINTFLESYDFAGKTIVPFCTSGSSGIGTSAATLHSLTDGAKWLAGRRFSGSASREEVLAWANGLGLDLNSTQPTPMPTPTPVSTPTPTPTPTPIPAEDDFAFIQGGTFQMGSPADEPERSSDELQHSVTVGNFYMAKTEVSQEEYQDVMGSNPSVTKGDNLPVTNLTWYDAVQYCNRRSAAEGLTPCYTVSGTTVTWNRAANGYRLPTEAEWEYAARANSTTPFHFGDYVHNSDANCYNAYGYNNDASGNWVNGSGAYLRKTVAVDQYPANAYGLHNMHGNAAEWVWDWYGEYAEAPAADPAGPESGNAKIIRGGGWNDHPKHIRSAYRGAQPADVGLYSIGVRPVRNAETSAGEVQSVYSAKAEQKTSKTLIVYFSQTGNTEGLANLIHEMSGADIFRLERQTPYASSSNGPVLYGEALEELCSEAVPELKAYPDIDQYDTILLGYCNWWSSIPASVRSFLLHGDFSGKTIVPFCSMGGGHFGQTISAIAKLAPDSVIKEGLEVTYSSYNQEEIRAWLEKSLPAQREPDPAPVPDPKPGNAHILVAYFSATNNTANIAGHLKAALGDEADTYEILAQTPYTAADLDYNTDCRANREQNDAFARPAIAGSVENIEQYDVVLIGYPIWWGQAPRIISTFLESYDFSGKTIIPFCTSGSSGIGSSAANLHSLTDGADWLDGRRFSGSDSSGTVQDWVNELGLDLAK